MTTKDERRATMLAEVRARRRGQRAPSVPPGTWATRAACNGRAYVFANHKRTADALAICATCPVLNECHEWALHNAVDGVAGGMTSAARTAWRKANGIAQPVVSVDDFLAPELVAADRRQWLTRSEPILKAVAGWTNNGDSARTIGGRLGVSTRAVARYRQVCRDRSSIGKLRHGGLM